MPKQDYSFLPDKQKEDISFLPDKAGTKDFSFLPDKVEKPKDIITAGIESAGEWFGKNILSTKPLATKTAVEGTAVPTVPDIEKAQEPTIELKRKLGQPTTVIGDIASYNKLPKTALPKKIGYGVGAGLSGIVTATGGIAKTVGLDQIGENVRQAGLLGEYGFAIPDPDFTYNLASGFGSMATFMIPGIGVQAGVAKLAMVAPKVAQIFGISVMAVSESAIEAGSVFNTLKEKGVSDTEARKRAFATFVLNLPTNWLSDKFGVMSGKLLQGGTGEGIQEGMQQVISNVFSKDPVLAGVLDSIAIGGITGGVGSIGIKGLNALQTRNYMEKYNRAKTDTENTMLQVEAEMEKMTAAPPAPETPLKNGEYSVGDKDTGSFGVIEGNKARIVEIHSAVKGSHFFEKTVDMLKDSGIKTIEVRHQSVDTRAALKRMVEKGILINPRGIQEKYISKHPTIFDISESVPVSRIPDFKSTQEAYKYGESIKDNPQAIAQLIKARKDNTALYNRTLKESDPLTFKDAFKLSFKGQFLKEAHEAAMGNIPAPATVAPSAIEMPPVGTRALDIVRERPKPIYDMGLEELEAKYLATKEYEKNLDKRILGNRYDEYRKAQRMSNNTMAGYEKQKQADKTINEIENSLTQEQQDELFGVGQVGYVADDYDNFRKALGGLDLTSPKDLGDSLKWAVTDIGDAVNPADMNTKQKLAYAQLRYAFEKAQEMGWNTKEISKYAIQGSARRFTDPEDALFMLRRFINPPQSKIPDFKSTQEAYKYGESIKDNPQAIAQLMKAHKDAVAEYTKTLKSSGPMTYKEAYELSIKELRKAILPKREHAKLEQELIKETKAQTLPPTKIGTKKTQENINLEHSFTAPVDEPELNGMYEDGAERENMKNPNIGNSIEKVNVVVDSKTIEPKHRNVILDNIKKIRDNITEITDKYHFFKDAPGKLRNAIRTDIVGALNQAYDRIYNKIKTAIWGGLSAKEVEQSVSLIFARNQLSRAKLGKVPMAVAEAEGILAQITRTVVNQDVFASVERYNKITEYYRQDLVRRDKLDANVRIEDYAPLYVVDYTEDWMFHRGIPTRLHRTFRSYTKQATGTTREYRKDLQALLGHFLQVEHDNMIDDFIDKWAAAYDVIPVLTYDQKKHALGMRTDSLGRVSFNQPKPNKIYTIDGVNYRAYNPKHPFSRTFYPLEVEDKIYTVLGKYSKTYLLPMNVWETFTRFSEQGQYSRELGLINKAIGTWKSAAILSRFTGYNINNILGDTWMAATQAPNPVKFMQSIKPALEMLTTKVSRYNAAQVDFFKFLVRNDILGSTFITAEMTRVGATRNPLRWVLDKTQTASDFREKVMRIAQAKYLYEEMKAGKGEAMRKYYNYVGGLEELNVDGAMGKIARDVIIDYNWTSKTYRRYIKGLLFPFGTWYFKGSFLMWKFIASHPFKGSLVFMSLPLASMVWNMFKYRDEEEQLPDGVRGRVHVIIGKTSSGNIKVLRLQMPQDALMGMKIFSVATNQAFRVAYEGKTFKKAAEDTIKETVTREVKGVAYLLNPIMRFIQGISTGKDPYSNEMIFPGSRDRLSKGALRYYYGLYFIKCSQPFLAEIASVREYPRNAKEALEGLRDNYISAEAFGVAEYSKKMEIVVGGKKIGYKEYAEMREKEKEQYTAVVETVNNFVGSDMKPAEYVKSPEFDNRMKKYTAKFGMEQTVEIRDSVYRELFEDLDTYSMWLKRKVNRAKTREEKDSWQNEYNKFDRIRFTGNISAIKSSIISEYLKK